MAIRRDEAVMGSGWWWLEISKELRKCWTSINKVTCIGVWTNLTISIPELWLVPQHSLLLLQRMATRKGIGQVHTPLSPLEILISWPQPKRPTSKESQQVPTDCMTGALLVPWDLQYVLQNIFDNEEFVGGTGAVDAQVGWACNHSHEEWWQVPPFAPSHFQ